MRSILSVMMVAAIGIVTGSCGSDYAELLAEQGVVSFYPTGLSYSPNPAVYYVGTAITPSKPTLATGYQAEMTYTVTPDLPAGLSIDGYTDDLAGLYGGRISGTPTKETAAADYTVTVADKSHYYYTGTNGQPARSDKKVDGVTYFVPSTTVVLNLTVKAASSSSGSKFKGFGIIVYNAVSTIVYRLTSALSRATLTGTSTAIAFNGTRAAASANGKFMFFTHNVANKVSVSSVNLTTGALTDVNSVAVTSPQQLAVAPSGSFVYSTTSANQVVILSASTTTGTLASSGTGAMACAPSTAAISADGTSLYAGCNAGTVTPFQVNTTSGALTIGTAVNLGAVTPYDIQVTADGAYVYISNTSGIYLYTRNTSSGALTASTTYTTANYVNVQRMATTGSFLYTIKAGTTTIRGYSIGGAGALTEISGSPFTGPTAVKGINITADGTGVLVAGTSEIYTFTRNTTTGALTAADTAASSTDFSDLFLFEGTP